MSGEIRCIWCCPDQACQSLRTRIQSEVVPEIWMKLRQIHYLAHDLALGTGEHWHVEEAIDRIERADYEQHLLFGNEEPLKTLHELNDVLELLIVLFEAGYFEEENEEADG